jgi:hypothetical protein
MNQFLEFLRPHPHRGDIIAAGAVPLSLAALVIELRMTQWPVGVRFVAIGLISGLLLMMGWLAPLERDTPRAYHSVLLVASLLPLIIALQLLAELLGAHRSPGAGANAWTFGVEAGVATALARAKNSAACTLIAALAGIVAVQALVASVFATHGLGTARGFLVTLALALAGGGVSLRDARRRHAVQLVNAAGLATLVLALTFIVQALVAGVLARLAVGSALALGTGGPAFGWELFVLAIGFGLVAYGSVDSEPGPGYIGALVLLSFAVLVSISSAGGGSLIGWPLFLLVLGAIGLTIGLRPRRPLPPQPGPASAAQTFSLHGEEIDG